MVDVNEPPEVVGNDTLSFSENTLTSTILHRYFARDVDAASTTFTWSLAGTDNGDFDISNQGDLTFRNTPNFERPADSVGNNEYLVMVRASDGSLTGTKNVTVTLGNVNEAPCVPRGDASITVPENTTSNLDRYISTDPDQGDTGVWDVSGADADNFRIDSSSNLAFDGAPDYEMPGDSGGNNEYNIREDAKDSGLTSSFDVTVTVTPVDEPPVITGRTTFDHWQENDAGDIWTYTAGDPESDANITWSLGGTDWGDFAITNGELKFTSAPDYEQPADFGRNNRYEVTVLATDSNNNRGEQHVDVIVKNVDEPPVIEGPDTVDDFPENASTSRQVARYTASDPERATARLSLTSGDTGAFTLASNGVLTFNNPPNYETQSRYQVTVSAEAGMHTGVTATIKPVAVNIENVEEPGTASLSTVQPQGGTSLEATLEDDDNEVNLTWQWYRTSSRTGTGTAITNATSRFYTPVDPADVGQYLRAVASYDDGHGDDKSAAAVSANRVQEAPTVPEPPEFSPSGDYERSIHENLPAGRNVGAPVTATDPNNDRMTYTIGASDYFMIVESSGQLPTRVELDREDQASHMITVTATDPSNRTDTVAITITVEDADETPVVTGGTSPEFAESESGVVASYTSTDPDDKGIEWNLTGTDSDDFTLSGGTLTFNVVPNFEDPADSNRDNLYQITIEARELGDGTSVGRLSVTVQVTNVDEPGVVEVPVTYPRVGQRLTPTIVDPDEGMGSTK